MMKHHAENVRIKRRYFIYLKEAESYSVATVDSVAMALARFEAFTKQRDFKAFHIEQATAFKRHLAEQSNQQTGEKLSKATSYAILNHLKKFVHWLAGQPGYKSRIRYSDANYFSPSRNDARVATARRERPVPTLEQITHVIEKMPAVTEIQRRDRAIVAFTILTGARDRAITTFKLKNIDLIAGNVFQDARNVKTKFGKSFVTFFFQLGGEFERIVVDWVTYLREEKLWGNDDPLFPATHMAVGESWHLEASGLERRHWSTAEPIRVIFKRAFPNAGLPYFNPHSFRHTLGHLAEKLCRTPEEFKAWSENLGHESVQTTWGSYGAVGTRRRGEIIRADPVTADAVNFSPKEFAQAVARELRNSQEG